MSRISAAWLCGAIFALGVQMIFPIEATSATYVLGGASIVFGLLGPLVRKYYDERVHK